jgi:hypothetical protein
MPDPIRRERFTTALIGALDTAVNHPVGDHRPPEMSDEQVEDGRYVIVWAIPGGAAAVSALAGSHDDFTLVYQVDSSGRSRQQADWMADQVRRHLLGTSADGAYVVPLAITGWKAIARELDTPGAPEREADDLYTVRERYSFRVAPA